MQKSERVIGVLGATSLVGQRLLTPEIHGCKNSDENFVAFTRKKPAANQVETDAVYWCQLFENEAPDFEGSIEDWICLAPIWVLSDYFDLLTQRGVRRIVVLSSTSRFTKTASIDVSEQKIARLLAEGEDRLRNWAEENGVAWIILRPTLIYGFGQDKNIAAVARLIRRLKFFPLLGRAKGLRQPIHADDVATACLQALRAQNIANQAYNISGAETLCYDEMIKRVFSALGRQPRYLRIPIFVFRIGAACFKFLPRFRNLTMGMAERMNVDLTFSHADASRDFQFEPRNFQLRPIDVEV
ncbi:NAD(P)-dependent oxidoreductase [uncultured Gimesia sp.]|uniref:NAD-dependent epimerase/dehydratase family protein n=1 Tax=uncultured Gimesia sp. TaxID=1678688 RepID=UPI002625E43F|nr:NAD-dependent epimerase/dehydratase family protein [uncultured Gimesia sp.]